MPREIFLEKLSKPAHSQEPWQRHFIHVGGVTTHYLEAGKGETLMLIHGGNLVSCAEINWRSSIPLFARSFHVIAADQIGFGHTPIANSDYSLKARGDHLINFLDTLKAKNNYVIGNSQGGWLGFYIALKRPNLVKKLVIVNSGSSSWIFLPKVEKEYPAWFTDHMTAPTKKRVRQELLGMTYHEHLVTSEIVEKGYQIAIKNFETHKRRMEQTHSTWDKANSNHSFEGKHISEHVNRCKMPVLLTWGQHDSIAPLEYGLKLYSRIESAEMHLFDRASHHVMIDQPDRFVTLVTDFLKS